MRKIAYKTANHTKSLVKNSLPDDYITEWIYTDQSTVPLSADDDWKFIDEDKFYQLKQQSNSEEKIKLHNMKMDLKNKEELNKTIEQFEKDKEERELYRSEFEEFLAWKKSK